ncbi:MAG: SOUL family heme-binding protein, partial [Hyphomonadaceae bacterium]
MTKSPLRPALALFLPLLSAIGLTSPSKAGTPEPTFKRVLREGTFEIRDYDSQVVAEVRVPEGRGDPASTGFRPLARYIFGGNKPRASIAMTAPVTRQQDGQSIAMTAPVIRQDAGAEWKVRFIMPEGSTLATMPVPTDPNVRLLEEPAKRYGVITFSGFGSQATMAQKSEELRTWLQGKKLTPIGTPIYAS